MTMTGEPAAAGAHLQARVDQVRAAADAQPWRTVVDDPTDAVDDDLVDLRSMGRQAFRGEAWRRIIPSRLSWARLDDFVDDFATPAEIVADVRHWAMADSSANLVLTGEVGVGKTHLAVAAIRPAFDDGMSVAFWPIVELLDGLRPGGPDGFYDQLVAADRLVIDDVGAERPTDWTADRFYALVNRRWLDERPTVYTTNLDVQGLRAGVGDRAYSRMVGSDAVVLGLAGEDRRRARL